MPILSSQTHASTLKLCSRAHPACGRLKGWMRRLAIVGLIQLLLVIHFLISQSQTLKSSILGEFSQDNLPAAEHRGHNKDLQADHKPILPLDIASKNKQRPATRGLARRKVAIKAPQRKHPPLGCQQFSWPNKTRSIAVVGNGPLSKAHRAAVQVILPAAWWTRVTDSHVQMGH